MCFRSSFIYSHLAGLSYLLQVWTKSNAGILHYAFHMVRWHLFLQALQRCKKLRAVQLKWNRHSWNFAFLCLCFPMCIDFPVLNNVLKKWSTPQIWKSEVLISSPDRQNSTKPSPKVLLQSSGHCTPLGGASLSSCGYQSGRKWAQLSQHVTILLKPQFEWNKLNTSQCIRSPLLAAVLNQL